MEKANLSISASQRGKNQKVRKLQDEDSVTKEASNRLNLPKVSYICNIFG
jgi:hypothetical protein